MRLISRSVLPAALCALAAAACSQVDGRADTTIVADSAAANRSSDPTQDADHVIDSGGIGLIRIGQTLEEAKRAAPIASFKRTSDGDGAILVEITLGPDTTLTVYADEADADSIDWSRRILDIQTFSTAFQTPEGVRVGSLVTDVEKKYGKVTEIILSEIEARQYVTFADQPSGLTFRLDYTGDFPRGSRKTTRYAPNARIFSISVRR